MLHTLKQALDNKAIRFQRFAFAYCKKDPKQLEGIRAYSWQSVDTGLQEILVSQLKEVVAGGTNDNCYEARFGADVICPPHDLVPGITRADAATPVGALMKDLVTTQPNLDGLIKRMGVLAAKYLENRNTRTAVLCLLLFKLKLPQGGEREYSFLTLVDGDPVSKFIMYEKEEDNLVTKELADVFREMNLTRGAIYPSSDQPAYDDQTVYVHVEREAAFWSQVLECQRVEATLGQQEEALMRITGEFKLTTDFMTRLKTGNTPILDGKELHAAAVATGTAFAASEQEVTDRLRALVPQGYVERAVLHGNARELTVSAGPGIEVKLASSKLDRIRQVQHGDRRYLVIDIDNGALVYRGKGQASIREVDWDDFIKGKG